jgi:hypothetical protein
MTAELKMLFEVESASRPMIGLAE